jgi:single-stranded DNA-binding protein
MSANPSNTVVITGRLARDPKVFGNGDGSATVRFTVMADRTYTDKAGVDSDAIPFKTYVASKEVYDKLWGRLHTGDLVTITGALKIDHYIRGGQDVYEPTVEPDRVKFLDSRKIVADRLAARVAAATTAAAADPELETAV